METKTEQTQPEIKQPVAPTKPAAKVKNETQPIVAEKTEAKAQEVKVTLSDFDAFLKASPKEWLPTMMVRIANKCLAEKVFASPGAMAEAIVGASKVK